MSKRDALRNLSKRFLPPPEMKQTFDAAAELHDRSAAIVVSAILESMLDRLIIAKLKNKSPDLEGRLFKAGGPLSDFHSKILVASAFGIVSPNMESELMRVRAIRNVFAHALVDVNFFTPEIAKEIAGFKMLAAMNSVITDPVRTLPKMDPKRTFVLMVQILCIIISYDHKNNHGAHLFE